MLNYLTLRSRAKWDFFGMEKLREVGYINPILLEWVPIWHLPIFPFLRQGFHSISEKKRVKRDTGYCDYFGGEPKLK